MSECTYIPPRVCVCPQVKIWEIPAKGVLKNLTVAWKELQGHSRRVSLIEWHPTANNILFSTGYDYQVTQTNALCKLTSTQPQRNHTLKTWGLLWIYTIMYYNYRSQRFVAAPFRSVNTNLKTPHCCAVKHPLLLL